MKLYEFLAMSTEQRQALKVLDLDLDQKLHNLGEYSLENQATLEKIFCFLNNEGSPYPQGFMESFLAWLSLDPEAQQAHDSFRALQLLETLSKSECEALVGLTVWYQQVLSQHWENNYADWFSQLPGDLVLRYPNLTYRDPANPQPHRQFLGFMEQLCDALPECQSLETISLAGNDLAALDRNSLERVLIASARPSVTRLNLERANLGACSVESCQVLRDRLPLFYSVVHLNLKGNNLGALDIQCVPVLCGVFPALPVLQTLSLENNQLSLLAPAGMQSLCAAVTPCIATGQLRVLRLDSNALGQMDTERLRAFCQDGVTQWDKLTTLGLSSNGLGALSTEPDAERQARLWVALQSCVRMEVLYISGNQLGGADMDDISFQAFLTVFQQSHNLRNAHYNTNPFTPARRLALASAIAENENLAKLQGGEIYGQVPTLLHFCAKLIGKDPLPDGKKPPPEFSAEALSSSVPSHLYVMIEGFRAASSQPIRAHDGDGKMQGRFVGPRTN